MQYSVVAVLALAGFAFANPVPDQVTTTTYTTSVITITSCAAEVTNCPGRVETQTIPVTYSYPAHPGMAYPTGGAQLYQTGSCPAGAACAYATGGYKFPQPTGYKGPVYTGSGAQVKAGAALAGVGAVAALLL